MAPRQAALALDEWDDLGPEFGAPAAAAAGRKSDRFETMFADQCRRFQLPTPERQLRFAAAAMGRQWKFDFAWREYMLAVEIQGVVVRRIGGRMVTTGAHADVQGMRDDHEKLNAAILLGWSVLQFTQDRIKPKDAIQTTMRVLSARGWKS